MQRLLSKNYFSTTRVIALGFLFLILLGSLLLKLPLAAANNSSTPYIDCLFTAATSVCVTGLTTVTTATHWSLFGKIIILILIQLGGLGIISAITGVMLFLGKKITLSERLLLEDALNLNSHHGIIRFLRRVFFGTLAVEAAGAVGYSFVFIPDFGIARGIWYSIFHSVSAFCNAGIDLLGDSSLIVYAKNPVINFVTVTLIILSGLGYIVWWDVLHVVKHCATARRPKREYLSKLALHSKIVLSVTFVLVLGGALFFFIAEYHNKKTIGDFNLFQKVMASIFQSVTTRTAGFCTIPQENLRESSSLISIFLMFIGGSPIGTAGGVKTTTIALLFLSMLSTVRGYEDTIVFKRTIPRTVVQKALAVSLVSLSCVMVAMVALSIVRPNENVLDLAYEVVSAIATVGLTKNFTGSLHFAGKIIIIICMYLGRIGPISLILLFKSNKKNAMIQYPKQDIFVG